MARCSWPCASARTWRNSSCSLQNQQVRTTISAGVCQYERGLKDVKELLDLADQAMYEAKKSEKNKVMRVSISGLADN